MVKTNSNYAAKVSERGNHSFSIYLMNHFAETQALANRVCLHEVHETKNFTNCCT